MPTTAGIIPLYQQEAEAHLYKYIETHNTPHKVSRSSMEHRLLKQLAKADMNTEYKLTSIYAIMVSHSFDALWVQYRNTFSLSRDQTRRYRPDDDSLEFEVDSDADSTIKSPTAAHDHTRDNGTNSDAVSADSGSDNDDEEAKDGTLSGINPNSHSQELPTIPEEDSEEDNGNIILDSDGFVISYEGQEGYEDAKITRAEEKAAKKAAIRKGKQPQESTSATDMEPAESQTADEQPAMSAVAMGKRPAGKTPAALKAVRSAITKKGKKPSSAASTRKPRARAASRAASNSRGTAPVEKNASRGATPNVQTRSRANTPAAEELGASNPSEVKKTQKKRKLHDVQEGSEPEEEVFDGEGPPAKKTKEAKGRGNGGNKKQ